MEYSWNQVVIVPEEWIICIKVSRVTRRMAKTRKESRRRSRSRSRDRDEASRHDSRKRSHRHREEEGVSSSGSDTAPSPVKVSRKDVRREAEETQGGSKQEELSIEETNKLRISLGLKPLEVDAPSSVKSSSADLKDGRVAPMKTEEVFVKTENISEKLEAEKIRERVRVQKEKRFIQSRLRAIKPLGYESDEEDDDALAWIEKSRELEKQKAQAKARELEEMDEEIQRQEEEKILIQRQNAYREKDLRGLTVGHSLDMIKEGTQVILTLRDVDLLDEDAHEDILENVNILDEEKAAENVLNKKLGKRDYNPYDDGPDGAGVNLLSKYDETIDGKKKETFKLGASVEEEISHRLKKGQEEIVSDRGISLDTGVSGSLQPLKSLDTGVSGSLQPLKFASEYYTEEEMKMFRKPRRIKKGSIRKRIVEEEDLAPSLPVSTSGSTSESTPGDPDFGSRNRRSKLEGSELLDTDENSNGKVASKVASDKPASKISLMDIDNEDNEPAVDVSGVIVEDDAEEELQVALEKARRLKERKAKSSLEQIASSLVIKRESEMSSESSGVISGLGMNSESSGVTSGLGTSSESSGVTSGLGMNSLAEFCRNIGETVHVKVEYDSDMNDSDEEELVNSRRERSDLKPLVRSSDQSSVTKEGSNQSKSKTEKIDRRKGAWTEVNDMEEDSNKIMEEDSNKIMEEDSNKMSDESDEEVPRMKDVKVAPILGEEPDLTIGVAAALKLAKNKGYLESESKKSGALPKSTSSISAVNYLIDEKFASMDERRAGTRDRYSGRVSEFQEKSGYKPEVNLEYIDQEGRILNEKEAFRQLSHKFHGKGPGKNKIDKRMKKLMQESKLRQMSSIDTPLNTVKKLQEKQKELASPYVVISGTETSLIKKK